MTDATSVIEQHQRAINERNLDDYLKTVVFPFTYQNFNGTAITVEKLCQYRELFPAPWEIVLKIEPNWLRTDIDEIQELAVAPTSAAYKVTLRWITSKESNSEQLQAIWIAVFKNSAWGIQFRHNMGIIGIE